MRAMLRGCGWSCSGRSGQDSIGDERRETPLSCFALLLDVVTSLPCLDLLA